MKKIVRNVFALLLALTFILSLAACGGNQRKLRCSTCCFRQRRNIYGCHDP